MVTDEVTVALDVSLLVRLMVTAVGAGADKVTAIVALCVGPTVTPEAKAILPGEETTTLSVPLVKPVEPPVMVPVPSVTPVRLNEALLRPAAMVTVGGLKVTRPPGATDSATLTPPVGAGELNVTVPLIE